MAETPETRESLLLRIRDPRDRDAWFEFVSIYRPLIYRVGQFSHVAEHASRDTDAGRAQTG